VAIRRGRIRMQLLDEERILENEALYRTVCRTGFGRGCEHVVRQTVGLMNE
jgi:hypothetical protein